MTKIISGKQRVDLDGFNNVYFFQNEKADEEMQKNLIVGYFKNKAEGYKRQDKVAGREIDEENYIDENWC